MTIKDHVKELGWFTDDVARSIAFGECAYRGNASEDQKIQATVSEAKKTFSQKTGLAGADLENFFALVTQADRSGDIQQPYCDAIKLDRQDDSIVVHDRVLSVNKRTLFCDASRDIPGLLPAFDWPNRSEIEKVAASLTCATQGAKNVEREAGKNANGYVSYASCMVIANHLDQKKFLSEITTDANSTPYVKLRAKIRWAETQDRIAALNAFYKPIIAKDPILGKAMTTSAEAGYAAWMTSYNSNAKTFDLARFILDHWEKRAQRKPMTNCAATLWPLVEKRFAAKKPADPSMAHAVLIDSTALLLTSAFTVCEKLEKRDLNASIFSSAIGNRTTVVAGPQQAAWFAAAAELASHADELGDDAHVQAMGDGFSFKEGFAGAPKDEETGIIQSVTPNGQTVHVTFKTERWMQEIYNCVYTDKLDSIDSDGKFVYQKLCTDTGKKQAVEDKTPAVDVEARFAGALKPGRKAHLYVGLNGTQLAVPVEVWNGKTLVGYLGTSW